MTNNHPLILLVDDDANQLSALAAILDAKGLESVPAQTGRAALDCVGQYTISVALIDLRLGDISGLDVLRGLKERAPDCECILLTGHASQNSAIEAIQLGVFGYFQKPFEVEQVVLSVQRAMDKYRSTLALRESEEKYRTVADFTYDWEAWRAPDGSYLYVSPSCERITGYGAAEFLADPNLFLQIVHPDDRREVLDHHEAVKHSSQEQDLQIAFRIITLQGKVCWVEHSCVAVHGLGGQWLGRRESNRDITIRKLAQDTLKESEELFRLAFEHAHVGMTLVDFNGRFLKINPQMCQMLGYSHEELEGKSVIEITHPDYWDVTSSFIQQAVSGKGDHSEFEKLYIHKNGSLVWGLVSSSLVRNTDGVPLYFISHVQDITARKRTENELLEMKASLEAANRELQTALVREQTLSHTDVLTGINNRRYLIELAEQSIAVASRYQQPLSVMMFDIDHFKQVNDTFGHDVGDEMLKRAAQIASDELRNTDVFGRYGGEEFIVLLPMTGAGQAALLAERIRAGVEALRVPTEKGAASITISIGIVEMDHRLPNESLEDIFRRADQAMYASKQEGRNRVVVVASH